MNAARQRKAAAGRRRILKLFIGLSVLKLWVEGTRGRARTRVDESEVDGLACVLSFSNDAAQNSRRAGRVGGARFLKGARSLFVCYLSVNRRRGLRAHALRIGHACAARR